MLVWSGGSSGGWREEDWHGHAKDEVCIDVQVLALTVVYAATSMIVCVAEHHKRAP